MRQLILALALLCAPAAWASTDLFFAPTSVGANNGTSCANAYAYNDGTHGWSQAASYTGHGTVAINHHICSGTYTAPANGNLIIPQANGAAGFPISWIFDQGAVVWTSPYFNPNNGAIKMQGGAFFIVDGMHNLTVQNTANGDALANLQTTTLISGFGCNSCIVRNTNLFNAYVATPQNATVNTNGTAVTWVSGVTFNSAWPTGISNIVINHTTFQIASVNSSTSITLTTSAGVQNGVAFNFQLGGITTQINAITMSGSNWQFYGNTVHDCGICINHSFGSNDTNASIHDNEIYNAMWAEGLSTGGVNACLAPCEFNYNNNIHDNVNWETGANQSTFPAVPACVYHVNGLHAYGTAGSSMNGVYFHDNWFHGSLTGPCASGFFFSETGGSQAGASNVYAWNNVFDASGADGPNLNGWVSWFSGVSGVIQFFNNYVSGPLVSDATSCWNISAQGTTVITLKNNVVRKCAQGPNVSVSGQFITDGNMYITPGASNSFKFNGVFQNSFAAWKAACTAAAGSNVCEPNSPTPLVTDGAALLNADGSPQAGSPVIASGLNLISISTGNLSSLSTDTSKGATRTPIARPNSAAWDIGAYESSTNFPPVMTCVPSPLNFGNVTQGTVSPTLIVTCSNIGGSTETISSITLVGGNAADFALPGGTCGGSLAAGASCTKTATFTPSTTNAETTTFTVAGTVGATVTFNGTGIPIPTTPAPTPAAILSYLGNGNMQLTIKNAPKCAASCTITLACQIACGPTFGVSIQ